MKVNEEHVVLVEYLLESFAKSQPTPITVDDARILFSQGKIRFASNGGSIGVVPVKGAARFSAARRQRKLLGQIDTFRKEHPRSAS